MKLNVKLSKSEIFVYQVFNITGLVIIFSALAAIYFCGLDFYIGMFVAFLGKLMALFFGYAYESQIRVWGVAPLIRFFFKEK